MPITFRHDAAGVVPPSNSATRKYGQQLVMQQQQQKYQGQQAGYDRLFQLGRDAQQNQNQFVRDVRLNVMADRQQQAQNDFQLKRDQAQADQQQQQQEIERRNKFMEDARKQSSGMIMQDIQNGNYDPATARELQQTLVAESEALGNPEIDATQRAEVLQKIRAKRAVLSANRIEKPPAPTPQEQFEKSLVTGPDGTQYRQNSKGDFEPLQQQPKRPTSSHEAFAADPKLKDKYMEAAIEMKQKNDEFGKPKPLTRDERKEAVELSHKLWEDENSPTVAPEMPAGAAPAVPGESQSILENPTAPANPMAQRPAQGMPPAPVPAAPMPVGEPQAAVPQPAPAPQSAPLPLTANSSSQSQSSPSAAPQGSSLPLTANSSSQSQASAPSAAPVPSAPQQVKVGGKPLVVSPGTLTPQETAARAQIMELPQEDRIRALMPYDPQLKGRTLEQALEDPESKRQYDELTKQGLTTGNYREDMLNHMDDMLQHNVLKGAGQSKPDAYVGMRADDITDPKAKAEVAKLPRPKSVDERNAMRSGQSYVDPDGIIRVRA